MEKFVQGQHMARAPGCPASCLGIRPSPLSSLPSSVFPRDFRVALPLRPQVFPQVSPNRLRLLPRDQEVNRFSAELPDEPTSLAHAATGPRSGQYPHAAPDHSSGLEAFQPGLARGSGSSFALLCPPTPSLPRTGRSSSTTTLSSPPHALRQPFPPS